MILGVDHGRVIRRHELSDAEREFVRPLLPESLRGRKRLDDRTVLNGIVWKFHTGTAWRGARAVRSVGHSAHSVSPVGSGRHVRPDAPGCPGESGRGWRHRLACVDRLHGGPRPPARCRGPKKGLRCPGLGRSRGGLTSKIHLACDAVGRPLAFTVTGGNTNNCTQLAAVMSAIRVPRIGPGRPQVRPAHVLGDKGCSSKANRVWLRRRGISHTIPERSDQVRNRLRRGSRGVRPPAFDKQLHKQRNVVERCFNRLKQGRGIATHYDKSLEPYQAAVTLASILMWA